MGDTRATTDAKAEAKRRLAEALRANLRRRKAARAGAPTEAAPAPAVDAQPGKE